jgi:5-(hydroxymethyl)furfural/furfural oxidase
MFSDPESPGGDSGVRSYDYVIVGAGAAGCVLANRLSADRKSHVLLIEAGRDYAPGNEPSDIRSVFPMAAFNQDYAWPDTNVHWRTSGSSPSVPLPQGRIVGGSSAIMGMWALRGTPADYDEWEQAGATGWGWSGVLPFFKTLETDIDFAGPLHGDSGPIPIRREPRSRWSPLAKAIEAESVARGHAQIADLNGDFRDGHCVMANSRFESSRGASGICYLTSDVRNRPNLTIASDTEVVRLLIRGKRAEGLVLRSPQHGDTMVRGNEIIVTAGALRTPALLLKAGIGPAAQLQAAGIEVVADRAGVGSNLQNHPVLYVCALLKPNGLDEAGDRPAAATYLRWSSGLPGAAQADMALYIRSYLSWHALGRRMACLAPTLQRPTSRGRVRLDPVDPARTRIEFNLLDNELDLRRLSAAFRSAAGYFSSSPVAALCGAPFVLTDAAKLMAYNRVTRRNAVQSWAAAKLMDLSPALGSKVLERLANLAPVMELLRDEATLRDYVLKGVSGTGHVCGTCRMGDPADPDAVCDSDGRVLGVAGLRVADASLMPTVPSGNTHIPTVMVAEKIAASVLARSEA